MPDLHTKKGINNCSICRSMKVINDHLDEDNEDDCDDDDADDDSDDDYYDD
jgi:hypothetical protein